MARRSKIEGQTRTDLIREYLGQNPSAGPKTVVKALKARGVDVSEGLVGQVKYVQKAEPITRPVSADDLILLKQISLRLGGIEKLRDAVSKLEEVERLG